MCSNYRPVTRMDRMLTFFGIERAKDEIPKDVFPVGLAPYIRLAKDGSGNRVIDEAHFGLVPHFAKELAYGRRTYNARSETVAKLPSFRGPWARGQRCVVPAEAIYEPCYETGKAVRTRISQHGDVPMGIAGIYNDWIDPDGVVHSTFAMLTVNADGHPVFKRMHRPEDEKRMVVILDPANYDDWLGCPVADAPKYFQQWMGELIAEPDALPPRAPRTVSGKVVPPPPPANPDPETGELF